MDQVLTLTQARMACEDRALWFAIRVFEQSRNWCVDNAVFVGHANIAPGNDVIVCKFLFVCLNINRAAAAIVDGKLSGGLQRCQKKYCGRKHGRGNFECLALLSHNEFPILGSSWSDFLNAHKRVRIADDFHVVNTALHELANCLVSGHLGYPGHVDVNTTCSYKLIFFT